MLKCFTPDKLELSATLIADKVELPRPTVYRMLTTLVHGGLLERNRSTGKYRIGTELYYLGSLYLSSTDLLKACEPVAKVINELTREAVNVGVLENDLVILIMKEESRYAFRISEHIGTVIPAHLSAMGKALLSELPEIQLDTLYPEEELTIRTKRSINTKTKLKLELEQIRESGVSLDSGEDVDGIIGVGAVIRDKNGKALGAMSISVPEFRTNEAKYTQLATLIGMGTSLVNYRLGYQDSINSINSIRDITSWWKKSQTDLRN